MIERSVAATGPALRGPVIDALEAGLAAVEPAGAVTRHVAAQAGRLRFGEHELAAPAGRTIVLGLGKASVGMARGLAAAGITGTGVIVSPAGGEPPAGIELLPGGHPIPDEASLAAGRSLMGAATDAGPDDLVVVLVSGGGSACAEATIEGVGLGELQSANQRLLGTGAPIEQVNLIRRHLSALKGGGLAVAADPAPVVTLVLSDVVGSPLEAIAGGPSVQDPSTPDEAAALAAELGLGVPIVDLLRSAPQPPDIGPGRVVLVGDGPAAAEAAAARAASLGWDVMVGDTALVGEARDVGARLAAEARGLEHGQMRVHSGETTVTLRGDGAGGRNQEVALAAAVPLAGSTGLLVAALGTDGIDGPTTSAGAVADGGTVARGEAAGLDAIRALETNDSGPFLEAAGDLLVTGPTGTNVGDLLVVARA